MKKFLIRRIIKNIKKRGGGARFIYIGGDVVICTYKDQSFYYEGWKFIFNNLEFLL